jgi:hypothetical protein
MVHRARTVHRCYVHMYDSYVWCVVCTYARGALHTHTLRPRHIYHRTINTTVHSSPCRRVACGVSPHTLCTRPRLCTKRACNSPMIYREHLYGAEAAQNAPYTGPWMRCDSIAVLGNYESPSWCCSTLPTYYGYMLSYPLFDFHIRASGSRVSAVHGASIMAEARIFRTSLHILDILQSYSCSTGVTCDVCRTYLY